MRDLTDRGPADSPDLVTFNYAVLGLVDELLWLPSAAVIATAGRLLYGPDTVVPESLLEHAGRGAPPAVGALLASGAALGVLLPSRLGRPGAWRPGPASLREARGVSRDRYRQLQSAFLSATSGRLARGAGSLVREMYAVPGRWPCAEGARRVLDRARRLNRAALALLAAAARGEFDARRIVPRGALPVKAYDLPAATLDVLAAALPPIAVPDFAGLAARLLPREGAVPGEEWIDRYQSLFAEMLGLSSQAEVRA